MAIAISGLRCELREVKLSDKPASMLAASPKGTVPILVIPTEQVIDESRHIMAAALAYSDPEKWIDRDDPDLINANDTTFKFDLDRYKYPDRHEADPLFHRSAGLSFLELLEDRLRKTEQLCGSLRGLADIAIVPFVRQFAAVDTDWFNSLPLPELRRWLSGHVTSPLFSQIMVRERPWREGDRPIYFPG